MPFHPIAKMIVYPSVADIPLKAGGGRITPLKIMIKVFSWNIRGIGHPSKVRFLKNYCHIHNPDIYAILEPWIQLDKNKMGKMTTYGKFISNINNKIWIMYKEEVDLEVLEDLPQMITCKISHINLKDPILISFVYGKSSPSMRRELWSSITSFDYGTSPWAIMGDFNATLSASERSSAYSTGRGPCSEFQDCVAGKELHDIGFIGLPFTWTNGKKMSRLDRALVNRFWESKFNDSTLYHLPKRTSDHCPLLYSINSRVFKSPFFFKFQNMWTKHP